MLHVVCKTDRKDVLVVAILPLENLGMRIHTGSVKKKRMLNNRDGVRCCQCRCAKKREGWRKYTDRWIHTQGLCVRSFLCNLKTVDPDFSNAFLKSIDNS